MGRRAAVVDLRAGDRPVLEGWAQRRKTAQALAMRARIVLEAADGESATDSCFRRGIVSGDAISLARPDF